MDTKGEFEFIINDGIVPFSTVLWEDTAPKHIEIIVRSKGKLLKVFNMWRDDKGSSDYWTGNSGMYIEQEGNKRIYHCNGRAPDDDFDDLIFSLEILD